MNVTFKSWDCIAIGSKYTVNDSKAILLIDKKDHSPVATATINLDFPLKKNHVFIKDYSENAGMTEALIEAGIIDSKPGELITSGFVSVYPYKLTEDAIKNLWR